MIAISMRHLTYIMLSKYLMNHESDIYHGINDFGDLMELFVSVFDRLPGDD